MLTGISKYPFSIRWYIIDLYCLDVVRHCAFKNVPSNEPDILRDIAQVKFKTGVVKTR